MALHWRIRDWLVLMGLYEICKGNGSGDFQGNQESPIIWRMSYGPLEMGYLWPILQASIQLHIIETDSTAMIDLLKQHNIDPHHFLPMIFYSRLMMYSFKECRLIQCLQGWEYMCELFGKVRRKLKFFFFFFFCRGRNGCG